MNITIEPGASALLDALHRAGFAAYAVGGCVRDSLLGLAPHDWDLCTAARPGRTGETLDQEGPHHRRIHGRAPPDPWPAWVGPDHDPGDESSRPTSSRSCRLVAGAPTERMVVIGKGA